MKSTGCSSNSQGVPLGFDSRIRIAPREGPISNHVGLLIMRDLDEKIGMTNILVEEIQDPRSRKGQIRHGLSNLLRQSIFSRIAGEADYNDAEHMAKDRAVRSIVGDCDSQSLAASCSVMARLESEFMTSQENIVGLKNASRRIVNRLADLSGSQDADIIDMDSTFIPVHGNQECAEWNGHYMATGYHPLMAFNSSGVCLGSILRPGRASSAEGWLEVLQPILEDLEARGVKKLFRADSAFGMGKMFDVLEDNDAIYAVRMRSNQVLQGRIPKKMKVPPKGLHRRTEPVEMFSSFLYQAKSWKSPRRVVAKTVWIPEQLAPKNYFIVTNANKSDATPEEVFEFYNQRGTAEQYIKEGKGALNWSRLSCKDFASNQVRFHLHVISYNFANALRTLNVSEIFEGRSWSKIQEKFINISASVSRHSRLTTFYYDSEDIGSKTMHDIIVAIKRIGEEFKLESRKFPDSLSRFFRLRGPPVNSI